MEKKYVLFLDSICRTILATVVEDTVNKLVVANPVVLQVASDQQNKVKIQLVPLIFRDIQKDPNSDIIWTFNPGQITRTENSDLNDRFVKQYEFVVGLTPDKAAALTAQREAKADAVPAATEAKIIKLFDEEKK